MNKDIAKRSHAQNKFLRRKDNRAGNHPTKGTPIPGPLTPTETAHKARRRARRLAKAKSNCSLLPSRLEKLQSRLAQLESLEKPQDSKHLQAFEHEIADTKLAVSFTEKEISRSRRILSALS